MANKQKTDSDISYLKSFENQDGDVYDIADFNTLKVFIYVSGTNNNIDTWALSPATGEKQLITEDTQTVKWYLEDDIIANLGNRKVDFVYKATVSNPELTEDQDLMDSDLNQVIIESR